MQPYWKVMIQLPTVEGWTGKEGTEKGYMIYSFQFTPLNQLVRNVEVAAIEEFTCTKWYKRKFLANMDVYDHYATTYPITELFFNDGAGEHSVAIMEREFRVLFGRYQGREGIRLTESITSCIIEKGDAVWFLFEVSGDLERFKLLGLTSDQDSQTAGEVSPDFLHRIQQQLKEVVPTDQDLRRRILIFGLQRILWSLVDKPLDWSLALWITYFGLRMYHWDLADGMELDAFEEAVEKDITAITPVSAFFVK